MHTVLSTVMLACCVLGMWGPMREGLVRNVSQWGPMALMLVAMADTTLGPGIFPGVLWALLLLLSSPLPLVLLPKARRGSMEIHRSMSILSMFAILVTTLPKTSPGPLHQTHEHSGLGGVKPALAIALALTVIAYSVILAIRPARQSDGRRQLPHSFEPVEALSSAGALGAMILMAL